MQHSLISKYMILGLLCALVALVIYLGYRAPANQDNLCSLFTEHPSWHQDTLRSQLKWGVPISVQMAIMRQESHFRANASPPFRRILGIIPWGKVSSAHGYVQALNSTWQTYLKQTHQRSARRSSFAKATDFIGWYINDAHQHLRIAKNDGYHLYLAYHEGVSNYQRRSYQHKHWLQALARQVQQQAKIYHKQLTHCHTLHLT